MIRVYYLPYHKLLGVKLEMKIKHIKGNTYCIDTGMTYLPFYKINEKDIILVDSGWPQGEREGLEELFRINNFNIVGIICSHAHPDHIGNNQYFKEIFNCVIAMPKFEALICSSAINLKAYYNNQTLTELKNHFGYMICNTDILISEQQDDITICGINFKILHTPGHSPAHICLITPDNVAYLGDALISYEVIEGAKIPYDFILTEDLKSKEKLFNLKCDKYIVAHKGVYDDVTNLIVDNMQFYKLRAEKAYELIDGKMTMEDIMKSAVKNFNIKVNGIYKYDVVARMLRSYVDYLYETNRIKLIIDNGFLKYEKM